jgi:trans-2,3-dihydro-3-hydroxyanthranilate isomerase
VGMQSQARPYAIFDVFSDRALAGNPLAVVFEADGLDDAALQGIAAEFNLSETVFVLCASSHLCRNCPLPATQQLAPPWRSRIGAMVQPKTVQAIAIRC